LFSFYDLALRSHDISVRQWFAESRTAKTQKITTAGRAPEQIIPSQNCNEPEEPTDRGCTSRSTRSLGHERHHFMDVVVVRRSKRRHGNESRADSGDILEFTHVPTLQFSERVLPSVQRLLNAAPSVTKRVA
jgi:hypothetical protein